MIRRFALFQTFMTVARSGRMREAAATLALTPGAVSQRIRLLEEAAGGPLFLRTRSGLELTSAGSAMFAALSEAFRKIEEVDRDLGLGTSRRVVVTTMPSFAANWLVPRLSRLALRHPQVEVVVETSSQLVDLKRDPVDLAVRHGLGKYPGLKVTWLMAPRFVVVGSPALIKEDAPMKTPADCLRYPLLHDVRRQDWSLWLKAFGVEANSKRGPAFSDHQLIVRAAVAGQGLALVRDIYAEDELRAGRLVQALDIDWPSQFAFYAVSTVEALQKPAVRQFRDWLIEEAKMESDGTKSSGERVVAIDATTSLAALGTPDRKDRSERIVAERA
jgi:LysR family transcriptional regulator, glycine cleavage system transcriptional activator